MSDAHRAESVSGTSDNGRVAEAQIERLRQDCERLNLRAFEHRAQIERLQDEACGLLADRERLRDLRCDIAGVLTAPGITNEQAVYRIARIVADAEEPS